uniref:Uncharacterized protein n=1 Tax=Rhipicephalus appendiculatus TaxID=34631 RepID=A0A131Y965_RHIAP
MDVKTVFVLALSAVLADMAQGQCRRTVQCRSPCQLGVSLPGYCGICVCATQCPICPSRCYFRQGPGVCPTCASARLCYR